MRISFQLKIIRVRSDAPKRGVASLSCQAIRERGHPYSQNHRNNGNYKSHIERYCYGVSIRSGSEWNPVWCPNQNEKKNRKYNPITLIK